MKKETRELINGFGFLLCLIAQLACFVTANVVFWRDNLTSATFWLVAAIYFAVIKGQIPEDAD